MYPYPDGASCSAQGRAAAAPDAQFACAAPSARTSTLRGSASPRAAPRMGETLVFGRNVERIEGVDRTGHRSMILSDRHSRERVRATRGLTSPVCAASRAGRRDAGRAYPREADATRASTSGITANSASMAR